MGRRARRWALYLAHLVTPRLTGAEHPHHDGRPRGGRGRKSAPQSTRAYRTQLSVGREYHLLAPDWRALVLLGHLARYLFAVRGGLAPQPADAQ